MTESSFVPNEESESGQSSHGADVGAGSSSGQDGGGVGFDSTDGASSDTDDSHAADVNAGFDDDSDSPVTGENGLDLDR